MRTPVWSIMRKNISVAQAVIYILASTVGITLIITALLFKHDASEILTPSHNLPDEYVTISKKVLLTGFDKNGFTPDEITELEKQPWVDSLGVFVSGDFNVALSLNVGGEISTSLFLESVPEYFLDEVPDRWGYQQGQTVPIIVPRGYLTLYNYGFATARNLPMLSESAVNNLPVILSISGRGKTADFKARIVGLSSRINSIIVPEGFMTMANSEYGSGREVSPTRLIVCGKADSDRIADYLEENGYQRDDEGVDTSLMAYIITMLTGVLMMVGTEIIGLSVVIQLLSLHILVEKNREATRRLIMLGYSPRRLRRLYLKLVALTNGGILFMGCALSAIAPMLWSDVIGDASFSATPYLVGFVVMLLLTVPVPIMLRRSIR